MIIKELITVEQPIVAGYQERDKNHECCFELYGFDIMLDSDLKAWLLEVNISPSFSSSSPFDKNVKTKLACDTLTLVGVKIFDHTNEDFPANEEDFPELQGKLLSEEDMEQILVQKIQAIDIQHPTDYQQHLILNLEEESKRQGGFTRIFPLQTNCDYYKDFFPKYRYNNYVIWKYLKACAELGGQPKWLKDRTNHVYNVPI